MQRSAWVAVGFLWLVGCSSNGSGGDEGTIPEVQRKELQTCVLQELPPPVGASAEWTVSGYVLVEAYIKCKASSGTAADFRAMLRDLARPLEGDVSRMRILASPGNAP